MKSITRSQSILTKDWQLMQNSLTNWKQLGKMQRKRSQKKQLMKKQLMKKQLMKKQLRKM